MEITPQKIISTGQEFPVEVQEEIVETLENSLRKTASSTPSEDEIEEILFAKGLISEIPERSMDEEEETYTAIVVSGRPLSEPILEGRE